MMQLRESLYDLGFLCSVSSTESEIATYALFSVGNLKTD